jgi:hypothetical protein
MADEQDDYDPITPEQFHEMASQLRFRKIAALFGSAVIIVLLIGAWFVAQHVLSSNARQDCKTAYSSILAGPVTSRDDVAAQMAVTGGSLESQLGSALLGIEAGGKVTTAVVQKYESTLVAFNALRTQLDKDIAVVNHLPTLNTASTKGFTFQGQHYPACPTA